jgi:hypothetical protein
MKVVHGVGSVLRQMRPVSMIHTNGYWSRHSIGFYVRREGDDLKVIVDITVHESIDLREGVFHEVK